MTLVRDARDHIERLVSKLEGENDFRPFMTFTDADGKRGYVSLVMPSDEFKASIADLMTAWLCVYRASEATFASITWAVDAHAHQPGVAPCDDPNHFELVMLVYANTDPALDESHTALLTREAGRAVLGDWEVHTGKGEIGGRFGNAMHLGMAMGVDMPPAGVEYCRDNEGDMEALMRPVLNAMVSARAKLAEHAKGN